MLPYAYYLLKVIICSGTFFGYYWLLLRNKIYHRYNRFYLLATVVLSLVMPLIQINIWHTANAPAQTIKLLQVVSGSNDYLDEIVLTSQRNNFSAEQLVSLLYCFTSAIFFSLFVQVFLKIRTLLKQHRQTVIDSIYFVNTTAKGTPFSFLQYIFWNDHIDISTATGKQIFKHELAHVHQKHSYDKLFINAVLIFYWCNPFFWLIRKELNMIHEFMADKIAVEDSDTEAFAAMILQATYPQHQFALTNPFFYSPIKRRLLMLTKNKTPKASYIGRVLVLPLAVLLFAAFTLKTKTIAHTPVYHGKKITVVLDAGHGGKDFGAVSLDGSFTEKDLALSISQKIKSMNSNDKINIILTRENDIYQSPKEKADFSKAQNPDLFVSIHVDGISRDSAAIKTGMSVFVYNEINTNTNNSKLFASAVINEFSNNYKIPVTMLPRQRHKRIWILKESPCPAILIEAGYITNKKDLAYLQTDEAKETIAKNVLAAIEKYANQNNIALNKTSLSPAEVDTIPGNSSINPKEEKNQLPENILYVLDGKVIGNGKIASDKVDKLLEEKFVFQTDKRINVTILEKKEAIKKFGEQGKYGSIEEVVATGEIAKQPAVSDAAAKNKTSAQTIGLDPKQDDKIFTQVENEPKFPGGESAWKGYLERNLNPSIPFNKGAPGGIYKVIVKFIVNKDGSISEVKAETKHGYGMDSAAVALIKKGPKWVPALQNGHNVTAFKEQPLTFVVEEHK